MSITMEAPRSNRRRVVGACKRSLERIALAALSQGHETPGAIASEARDLLECDAALLLAPVEGGDVVTVVGVASEGGAPLYPGSVWRFRGDAAHLFERTCHAADGWRQPWSGLAERLRDLHLASWTGIPLYTDDEHLLPAMLVVGSRRGPRPCQRMDRLHHLARSAASALSWSGATVLSVAPERGLEPSHPRNVTTVTFGVAHTLANIFSAIIGNLHFVREEFHGQISEDLVDRLHGSACDGIELMRSLQKFTSLPACREMEPVDVARLAADVVEFIRSLCLHWHTCRAISIEVNAPRSCEVWGHAGQVSEALINLIFNAIHAIRRDGRIVVSASCFEGWSELRVSDDGTGMSNEAFRRATEPFFTTDPESRQGLGLTVARGIATAHRGSLTLQRGSPRGIEAALRLPTMPPDDEHTGSVCSERLSTASSDG